MICVRCYEVAAKEFLEVDPGGRQLTPLDIRLVHADSVLDGESLCPDHLATVMEDKVRNLMVREKMAALRGSGP